MADETKAERVPLYYLVIDRLTQPQFLLAIGSGILLWWLTYQLLNDTDIPTQDKSLIAALVGFISGQMVGPGWQFYFGNTKASDEKTKALADNAASMRRAGDLPGGGPQSPTPVVIEQPTGQPVPVTEAPPAADPLAFQKPDLTTLDDLTLRQMLTDKRVDDVAVIAQMDREALIARITELESLPSEPPA